VIVPPSTGRTPADRNDGGSGAPRPVLASVPSLAELRAAAKGALASRLSPKYLEQHSLLPLHVDGDGDVVVAVGGPAHPSVLDELSWLFDARVRTVDVDPGELHSAILAALEDSPVAVSDLRSGDLELLSEDDDTLDDLRALASQPPVIKLVNTMILEALRARASDIHIESASDGLRARYRIDGVLREVARPPRQYQAAVVSRIKIMASLNIAERRLAQDGRIRIRLSDRELDIRVAITPSLHGESVVLRILDRGAGVRDLAEIGMGEATLAGFAQLVKRPHGIVLVTGPTGSGKTTTLYGALSEVNVPGVKIVTVEDPVEYQVDGVTQIPVNVKAGLTFASALRSILRHDPDVIMVGEMRDRETADVAIQAALTGHLVFSTLHTNDAPTGVTRLVDMGVEPYLVSATVQGILAQRLVRRVCDDCADRYTPSGEELRALTTAAPHAEVQLRRGMGCERCSGTGYRGRTGIYELMVLTDALRERISAGAPAEQLRAVALAAGMVPLRDAGWACAAAGITTVEEVLRVTYDGVAV